jgi:hypothetical protein
MQHPWFKAKKYYGWGWYPARWQGWAVLLAWFAPLVWLVSELQHGMSGGLYVLLLALWVAVLLVVCWLTGERPQWRWAGRVMSWKQVMLRITGIVLLAMAISFVVAWFLAR